MWRLGERELPAGGWGREVAASRWEEGGSYQLVIEVEREGGVGGSADVA